MRRPSGDHAGVRSVPGLLVRRPEDAVSAFHTLSGSMIHDLYCLRTMLGMPESVVSAEVWNEGRAISTVLSYGNGARCVASWVDLPELWDFRETLEVYGDDLALLTMLEDGTIGRMSTYKQQSPGRCPGFVVSINFIAR